MKTMNCLMYPVFICCIALFSFGCSSSSGGGDDTGGGADDISSLSLPNPLAFTVHDPWTGEDYPDMDLLSASIYSSEEVEIASISIINPPDFPDSPGIHMEGTYNTATEATTLFSNISEELLPSFMWIDSGDPFGVMGLSVPRGVTVEWVGTDNPTSGSFTIDYRGDVEDVEDNFEILIEVVEDADELEGDQPGVRLTIYNGINPGGLFIGSYTWDIFEDLEDDDEAEPYEQIASFCYGVWEVIFERVGNCFNTTALFIEYSDDLFNQGGSATIPMGSIFPPTGERGSATCSWTDNNDNNEMGDTDDFSLSLTNLWEDDEDDDIGEMYNGTLSLYGLLLDIDDANDVITAIGGNFDFAEFKIQETLSDNSFDEEYVIFNGGFNITAEAY